MRFDSERRAEIYDSGDSFPYAPNGTCYAKSKLSPCLQHGFVLSYESPDEVSTLDCTTVSSRGRLGLSQNPSAASVALVTPWSVRLEGHTGSYTRTRSWSVEGTADPSVREVVTCRVKGQDVFTHTFTITDGPHP